MKQVALGESQGERLVQSLPIDRAVRGGTREGERGCERVGLEGRSALIGTRATRLGLTRQRALPERIGASRLKPQTVQ